jgi:hypothetical protein
MFKMWKWKLYLSGYEGFLDFLYDILTVTGVLYVASKIKLFKHYHWVEIREEMRKELLS